MLGLLRTRLVKLGATFILINCFFFIGEPPLPHRVQRQPCCLVSHGSRWPNWQWAGNFFGWAQPCLHHWWCQAGTEGREGFGTSVPALWYGAFGGLDVSLSFMGASSEKLLRSFCLFTFFTLQKRVQRWEKVGGDRFVSQIFVLSSFTSSKHFWTVCISPQNQLNSCFLFVSVFLAWTETLLTSKSWQLSRRSTTSFWLWMR